MNLDYAWVAGVIEGEGHFSSDIPNNTASIVVSMTDKDVIESLKESADGLGVINGPYSHKDRPDHKPMWRWTVTKRADFLHVAEQIMPYLHQRRRSRLQKVIDGFRPFCLVRRNPNINKTHCIRGHEFTPENTYITPRGTRNCKECRRTNQRERRHGSQDHTRTPTED